MIKLKYIKTPLSYICLFMHILFRGEIMKQSCIRYAKLVSVYLLTCLLCSLLFSIFYYFRIIDFSIFHWGNYVCSVLIALLLSYYLIKKTEKKAFLSVVIFLSALWLISLCCMPFLSISFTATILRFLIVLLLSFLFLLRK